MEIKINPYIYAVPMVPARMISAFGNGHLPGRARVIWKAGSIVFYFSNRFISMFGIVLKSYIFAMLWHKFPENVMM